MIPPWAPQATESAEEYRLFAEWLYGDRLERISPEWDKRAEAYDLAVSAAADTVQQEVLLLCEEQLRRHRELSAKDHKYLMNPRDLAALATSVRKIRDAAPVEPKQRASLKNVDTETLKKVREQMRGRKKAPK